MKALRTKTPAALDNPARWNLKLRPWFNADAFQQRIDERVGLDKNGNSIILLRWAPEVQQRLFEEWTPRYWTRRRRTAANTFEYWQPPRWIFEKRIEPEQYAPNWNATRFTLVDEYSQPLNKGDAPTEYSTFAWLCADHEGYGADQGQPACCMRHYYTDRSRCWGTYRTPNELDLTLISQAVREMEAAKFTDPYAPLSTSQLAEAEVAANMQAEEAARQFEAYEQQMIQDYMKSYGWMLTETDPGVLAHGRYHDLGAHTTVRHRKVESTPTPLAVKEHLTAITEGKPQPEHT